MTASAPETMFAKGNGTEADGAGGLREVLVLILANELVLSVPAKKSVLVGIVAFAKALRVGFPSHVEPNFLPARLFPGSRCSAS